VVLQRQKKRVSLGAADRLLCEMEFLAPIPIAVLPSMLQNKSQQIVILFHEGFMNIFVDTASLKSILSMFPPYKTSRL
jgi:hypothetical protein